MAPFKLLPLACASALLIAQANTQGAKGLRATSDPPANQTYTVALGNDAVCLAEVNDARGAAGLAKFVTPSAEASKWPQINNGETLGEDDPWLPVCEALIAKDEANIVTKAGSKGTFESGTYAFMALNSDQPDCAAAVDHWKEAVTNFNSIPPSKTQGGELYDKQQNLSFVALYNPINDAAADCRVVTCTQKTSGTDSGHTLRSDTDGKKGYALLCRTTPDAFTDNETAPFTDDQWSKIKTSITGSASAVAPSLLAFVAVGLGLAAL